MKVHRRLCVVAGLLGCMAFGSQQAKATVFTYELSGPTGNLNGPNGGTIGGTITFSGTAGDIVPALNTATTFDLTYTPPTGPAESFTPPDPVTVQYNGSNDFFGQHLGDAVLTATPPSQGADFWTVDDGSGNEFNLFFSALPAGPSWQVRNSSGPVDAANGAWTLTLVPEPQLASALGLGAMMLARRKRRPE